MPQERDVKKDDSYVTQLGGLLPAELTGVYIAARALFDGTPPPGDRYVFVLALVLGIISFFILPQLMKISGLSQRILYVLSFFIWVVTIEIARVTLIFGDDIKPLLIGLCLIWTFAVPYFFKAVTKT